MKILSVAVLVVAVSVASPSWGGEYDPFGFSSQLEAERRQNNVRQEEYSRGARDSYLLMESDRLRRQLEAERVAPVSPSPRVCSVNGRFIYCW